MTMPEIPLTPRRTLTLGLRAASGGGTPGIHPSTPMGTANPLQSVQFGAGSPANAMSHDNPVSNATPNSPAASGMSGTGSA